MKQRLQFFKHVLSAVGAALQWRLGKLIALVLGLTLAWAVYPTSALATTWQAVAETSQGQQQQFVDIDSIEPVGWGHVRVGSYYVDRRSGQPQRTDYLTEYDCDRRRFRDVEFSGPVGSSGWMPVDPDPLNSAAMEYACEIVAQSKPD
ncbi:hypothetical protein H6F75_03005 [Nodosilinea sp. FACHB-131]|uniref:hypothetical protein n=1 Tax=Cyanophyceae TaxID=3028117 RepID=UPI0016849A19|nr:hypothetical protein [Nodosilinea sp. FACHB-131]MBD1872441.1 hypothetical protein [Nodosilinea sp. FACHB-131]